MTRLEAGLDGQGMQLHTHAPAPAILNTHVLSYIPKTLHGVIFQLLLIHSFSTLLSILFLYIPS